MRALWSMVLSYLFLFSTAALADNRALLQKIVQRAQESRSDSLVIVQNGQTLYSNYFGGRDAVRSVQSVTKSICALAIGVLLDKGKISSLDLPMYTWIPRWISNDQKSKITLRMIMSHTSGLPDVDTVPDFWSKPDTVLTAENTPLRAVPGRRYLYSNIGASLLQPVIEQASGQSVTGLVRDRIFDLIGVSDFSWSKDQAGHEITSGGLSLSTADLLRIGTMLLQRGSYDGQVIIHPTTLQMLVARSQPYFPYGLLFWLDQSPEPSTLFWANGWGGQYIMVFPEKNLIVVRTKDPLSIDMADLKNQASRDLRSLIPQWN